MDTTNLEGQTLGGRYQIASLIGRGGMAAVYKAHDPNLRRHVAIKVIHSHLSNNPDFVRRFEEEAAAVARLRHPNIVQVFDFNHENGLYYMVMEFITGETLQTHLKRLRENDQRMRVEQSLNIAADICAAAEEAHRHGLIHRDIKPANVMLAVNGNAVLMDFGVARILGGAYRTITGSVLGTAMYMAPEQIQGYHVDARADIYSIGVMLFEMLGGRPPFEADSAMTVMMMHLNDPVPDIRRLQPETPPIVVELIDRALAKKPELRFQNSGEMGISLRKAASDLEQKAASGSARRVIPPPLVSATLVESAHRTIVEPQAVPMARKQTGNVQAQPDRTYVESAHPVPGVNQASAPAAQNITQSITAAAAAAPQSRKNHLAWLLLATVLLLVGLGLGGYLANRSYFNSLVAGMTSPEQSSRPAIVLVAPTDTPTPQQLAAAGTATVEEPVPTSTPVITELVAASATLAPEILPSPTLEEVKATAPLVIGGADKIAYLNGSDIWVANLDGSELTQLTSDGSSKSYLRWLPDGQGLIYISGTCLKKVSLGGEDEFITCFPNSDYLDSFEISPDGTQAVISLDHMLYLIPFDLEKLKEADRHSDLASMASCPALAPYQRNFAHMVRWSKDGKSWAALILGVLEDGRRGDIVQVFAVDHCIPNPMLTVHFPHPHFSFREYDRNPNLESIAWDGNSLFSFHDSVRNHGFGNLHVFNLETYRPRLYLNPIDNVCCYRDVQWSPDGKYLLFAFQNYLAGSGSTTQLYYIPYGTIGSGAKYEPLPLPEITDPREKPQPVLRPALTP
jgi:serine/threonine protein kinase